jgi:hypothetical protein
MCPSTQILHCLSALRHVIIVSTHSHGDHPSFVGLQAHPEFFTRPLNLSPPLLGLLAAACEPKVLDSLTEDGAEPPHWHPKEAMIEEQALIQSSRERLSTAGWESRVSPESEWCETGSV